MATLDRFDGFALDLDGVVWLAGEPIPGAPAAVNRLRERAPVVFLTNDPRSTREEYVERLRGVGVEAELGEMLTSSAATAEIIARGTPGASVYVVGSGALGRELTAAGLEVIDRGGPGVDFVVVGGHAGFDYAELAGGMAAVRAGAELWATNRDPVYPTAKGLLPGTGALVAAVETASGRIAKVAGKPERPMFEAARRHLGAERPVIVGDSLDSDIAGGVGAGFATVLVLTGRASAADAEAATVRPDAVVADLAAFAAGL